MRKIFSLYKYFNVDGEIETSDGAVSRLEIVKRILINNKIYIPSLKKLNDPFEFIINSHHDFNSDNDPSLQKGILSFSTAFNNILLWSHYGNGHTGIAIKFRVDESELQKFKKVQYIKNIEELILLDKLLAKSTDWAYENEYRRVLDFNSKEIELDKIGLIIEGIIFGFNNKKQVKDELRDICLACDLKWGDIFLSKNDFSCELNYFSTEEDRFIRDYLTSDIDTYDLYNDPEYIKHLEENQKEYENDWDKEIENAKNDEEFKKIISKKALLKKQLKID